MFDIGGMMKSDPTQTILGNYFRKKETEKYNEDQEQLERDQMAMQKQFAQLGIRWKVEDANAAGIHPLAALGANTMSYTPVQIGQRLRPNFKNPFANLGQMFKKNSGRSSQNEALVLENMGLQNDLLRAQIRKMGQSTPEDPKVDVVPAQEVASVKSGITAGKNPMEQITNDQDGNIYFPASEKMAEVLESDHQTGIKYNVNKFTRNLKTQGRALMNKLFPNKSFQQQQASMKKFIANEYGIHPRFVHYRIRNGQFFIDENGMRLINYNQRSKK